MSTSGKALIIFVKEPREGKVKTRLAATIGNDRALEIYERLLDHTDRISEHVNRFIFHVGDRVGINHFSENDSWIEQEGKDLGKRMLHAFRIVFNRGYGKVLIIGSDCAELSSDRINAAFDACAKGSVVIGPALDGGYYLLGMTEMHPALFDGIEWSTSNVCKETIERAVGIGLQVTSMETLRDIDTEADLEALGWA